MPTEQADQTKVKSTVRTPRAADTIENPVTGERITFLNRSQDTDGEFVRIEVVAAPGAIGPPEHLHPRQEEYFRVLSGTLSGRVDGNDIRMAQGEEFTVWPGTAHVWGNDDDEDLRVLIEMRPAMQFERFLETFHGLGRAGKTDNKGMPNPLQMAVFEQAYWDDVRVARPPAFVQKAGLAVLAPIGRLLGYQSYYPEYSPLNAERGNPSFEGAEF